MTDFLFDTVQVGPHRLKNRFVMPAMHLGLCDNGHVSEAELRFYGARAEREVGLIIVGLCNTFPEEQSNIKGVLELSSDIHIESMAKLHRVIAAGGAKSAVQLSPVFGYNNPAKMPDEATLEKLIDSIGTAANRARQAGFDFVELMLSGGSLLSHLLSSHHNSGVLVNNSGTLEHRLRAPLEAMASISRHAPKMPVIVRMHGHEYLENGYGLDEAAEIAAVLEQHGACALDVTVAGHRTTVPQITRQRTGESFSFLGRNIRDAVNIPVFYGSRIRTLADAEAVFEQSGADAITVGRALIADDSFVLRIKDELQRKKNDGAESGLVNCMGCCHCLDTAFTGEPLRCTVNPGVRMGDAVGKQLSDISRGDRVLVAGSGPAGMQAALLSAARGAEVTLVEQASELGGKWRKVAALNSHGDLQGALDGFVQRLASAGVTVVTHTAVTSEYVKTVSPNILVWAVGASPKMEVIEGAACHPCVIHVQELLDRKGRLSVENAVVVGGNAAGVTAALHLARPGYASNEAIGYLHRFGSPEWAREAAAFAPKRNVTVLKRRGFFGKGMGRAMRWTAVQEMKLFGVNAIDKVTYDRIESDGIWIFRGRHRERIFIPADMIVLATGFSNNSEIDNFAGLVKKVVVVGDAEKVGNITAATHAMFSSMSLSG